MIILIQGDAMSDCSIRIYLLGTGGPEYTVSRSGYSTLIEIEGKFILFDVGRNTAQRLYECGVPLSRIEDVFLTHLHSDHYEGLPNLWMAPWFLLGEPRKMKLRGPAGTGVMTDGMFRMFSSDLRARPNCRFKREYLDIETEEFASPSKWTIGDAEISSFEVEHGDGNPAYGYKVEYSGHTVVLSGDTCYHSNTVKAARNADVLIHNVVALGDSLKDHEEDFIPVLKKLSTPEAAAEVFIEAEPHLAVYSHICKKGLSGKAGDEEIIARTRKAGYSGPLLMGHDRTVIEVGDEINVINPPDISELNDLQ